MMAISMKLKNRKSWKKLNPAGTKVPSMWEMGVPKQGKNGCGTIGRN